MTKNFPVAIFVAFCYISIVVEILKYISTHTHEDK